MTPPDGFREVLRDGVRAWVRPEAVGWAEEALDEHGSLHGAASRDPAAREIEGRGTVYTVPAVRDELEAALGRAPGRWAVRHYRRGGAVARLLGDRYLRTGTRRPFRELLASEEVRARRIPTPRVVAAAVYPAGVFYRGDLVTAYLSDAVELAEVLFDPGRTGVSGTLDRRDALKEAGILIRTMARAGVRHPDLNARNILLQWTGHAPDAWVLDLDRCHLSDGPDRDGARTMRDRLVRSIRKLEKKAELEIPSGDIRVLDQALST